MLRRLVRLDRFQPLLAVVACLIVFATAVAPASHAQSGDRQVVDQIVAIVGDNIVLKSEVDQMVRRMMQQSRNTSYSKEMWMQALDQLVNEQVLAEAARRDTNIVVTDEQVSQRLDMQIEQLKQRAGGEEQLESYYGKSIIEIKEDFRGTFRDQLLASQIRSQKLQDVDVTPSEVRQWFEQIPQDSLPRLPETVRLAHIVRYPTIDPSAKEEAREIITTIRDSIVNKGASFEEMARQFSDDPGSAEQGGRIADLELDAFVPEFAAVASQTPVGEVSQVFYNSTHKGYHILRVNKREAGTVNLNHILIRVDQSRSDGTQAMEYLSAVRDTLVNREIPFELMARRHSEEERSAKNGGRVLDPQSGVRDLVLQRLGPSWRRTINSIDEGEISEPTEVQLLNGENAFHIVLLQRRLPAHRVNLDQDYERIRQLALQDKRQRIFQEWVTDLREDIYVDIRIEKSDLTAMRF
jgi:peptidyl-prolyl cis-trans isomerase SurA